MKHLLRSALLALALASPVAAQNIRQLTRSTAITGVNDSALVMASDSAGTSANARTRAVSTHELFKRPAGSATRPSFSFALDSTTGLYRFGKDTIGVAVAGLLSMRITDSTFLIAKGRVGRPSVAFTGLGTTGMYVTGSNNVALARAGTETVNFGLSLATWSVTHLSPDGTVSVPSYSFNNSTGLGTYRFGADTLGIATSGVHSLDFSGGATVKLRGGAGNMTVQCGTGNSRTCTFQSTTSAGVAKNVLVLGADTSATLIGQLRLPTMSSSTCLGADSLNVQIKFLALNSGICYTTNGNQIILVQNNSALANFTTSGLTLTAGNFTPASSSVTAPAYRTGASETQTGIYRSAANEIAFTNNGAQTFRVTPGLIQLLNTAQASDGTVANPSYSWTNSTGTGLYRFGADTVGVATGGVHSLRVSGGASPTIAGGAGNLTFLAGTGANRSFSFQGTNGSSTPTSVLNLSTTQMFSFVKLDVPLGTTAAPSISFNNGAGGLNWTGNGGGSDTVHLVPTLSTRTLSVTGGAAAKLLGGAGNMTVVAGTGNDRNLIFQSSNASGTATTFAQGGGDTLKLAGHLIATGLTSEASTQSALCVTAGGGQVFINAAPTCTVSSRKFKTDIAPLGSVFATRSVMALRPSTFTYKSSGQQAIGLIAEEADSVDHRLATRDGKGQINSVNYEQVTILLLKVVQQQQKSLDSLTKVVAGIKKQ